jgi:hypothetical protein
MVIIGAGVLASVGGLPADFSGRYRLPLDYQNIGIALSDSISVVNWMVGLKLLTGQTTNMSTA